MKKIEYLDKKNIILITDEENIEKYDILCCSKQHLYFTFDNDGDILNYIELAIKLLNSKKPVIVIDKYNILDLRIYNILREKYLCLILLE